VSRESTSFVNHEPAGEINNLASSDVQRARAYAPGLTNFQLVGTDYYFAPQFGPQNAEGDVLVQSWTT